MTDTNILRPEELDYLCKTLQTADHVLIAAGSGLSAAAGANYGDQKEFARLFPGMVARGFSMRAELIGYDDWEPALKWGYLAASANQIRFEMGPHPVYTRLLDLIAERDYFVLTTNADGMFKKSGFDPDRLYTPQGDYSVIQCQTPCSNDTWPSKPYFDRILPAIDRATQLVTDASVLPRCPNCGGDMMLNVRGGTWFVETPWEAQAERFQRWIDDTLQGHLLIIEIGAGFNTPGVIRWPMERVTHTHPDATLVRVNPQWSLVPQEIADKSLSLAIGAEELITPLWGRLVPTREDAA